jgi:hypothetical protein
VEFRGHDTQFHWPIRRYTVSDYDPFSDASRKTYLFMQDITSNCGVYVNGADRWVPNKEFTGLPCVTTHWHFSYLICLAGHRLNRQLAGKRKKYTYDFAKSDSKNGGVKK